MKGKYAARATLRREDSAVRSEVESYQHAIKRLTAERDQARSDLAASRATHKEEVRKLRVMLDEGLTPELLALRRELERHRERADKAASRSMKTIDAQGRLIHFTSKLLHNITGCTGLEAMERILAAVGGLDAVSIADEKTGVVAPDSQAPDRVHTLQRVRGWRSSPAVIGRLDELIALAAGRGE